MSITLSLPNLYGWVLLSACFMGFSILIIGFFFAGRARSRIFSEAYMKENFGKQTLGNHRQGNQRRRLSRYRQRILFSQSRL